MRIDRTKDRDDNARRTRNQHGHRATRNRQRARQMIKHDFYTSNHATHTSLHVNDSQSSRYV